MTVAWNKVVIQKNLFLNMRLLVKCRKELINRCIIHIAEKWRGKSWNTSSYFHISTSSRSLILGIETSCDDTGCAIVDNSGRILGEALHSQQETHLKYGGIIPPVAKNLHRKHIDRVVKDAVAAANIDVSEVDAIATTVKPGLPLSLVVGMEYGKQMCLEYDKPFIPIHHMEAHALTIRMIQEVEFPFLVLLISGGHCLLSVVKAVDKFLLLGSSLDDAPGEAFDKVIRRLKLRNMPEFCNMSGGAALEKAAERGDPLAFEFPSVMTQYRDCNFSLAGLKNKARRHIIEEEIKHEIEGDGIIPGVFDLCASFQLAVSVHLCRRVQRAMDYIELKNLLPSDSKHLVVSGGVACNGYIAHMLSVVCGKYGYELAVPPPHLCTDNGVMIAWNGMERWQAGVGIYQDFKGIDIESKCPLGEDIREDVAQASIKCNWIKLKNLMVT
ncbi:tRNA N6-adenosine threonylcarbamoyltransferase, mitochondrial isoform X2 [Anabrus simplex]|uniref:tRNA N6-adenosine threonylcarbamoyltransferase, mitochondrial isoform X2 n=1 Tax=Anabrus simplex TaxID=316456 RepID=UPI0034DD3F66